MSEQSQISRDDVSAKFAELRTEVDNAADSASGVATKGAIVGGIILLLLIFVLGRRRGRAGRTVVEVRRI